MAARLPVKTRAALLVKHRKVVFGLRMVGYQLQHVLQCPLRGLPVPAFLQKDVVRQFRAAASWPHCVPWSPESPRERLVYSGFLGRLAD
jgi:hypothetical protein